MQVLALFRVAVGKQTVGMLRTGALGLRQGLRNPARANGAPTEIEAVHD